MPPSKKKGGDPQRVGKYTVTSYLFSLGRSKKALKTNYQVPCTTKKDTMIKFAVAAHTREGHYKAIKYNYSLKRCWNSGFLKLIC